MEKLIRIRQAVVAWIQKVQFLMLPPVLRGSGSLLFLPDELVKRGIRCPMVVTTSGLIRRQTLDAFFEALEAKGLSYAVFSNVTPDPEIADVATLANAYQKQRCDAIIAVGGGSVIDCSKAALAAIMNKGMSIERIVHANAVPLRLPFLAAVPTTAGSGSEVTAGAVIADVQKCRKYAVTGLGLLPKLIVLDADLSVSLPAGQTGYTGMDALSHALEAFINRFNNRRSRIYALESMALIRQHLHGAYQDGQNKEHRQAMLEAAYRAGIAITANFVGNVHALSHGVGGLYHLPHGFINAVLLLPVLEEYGGAIYPQLAAVADHLALGGAGQADKAKRVLQWIAGLNSALGIPKTLKELREADLDDLAAGACAEANPGYPTPVMWKKETYKKVLRRVMAQ